MLENTGKHFPEPKEPDVWKVIYILDNHEAECCDIDLFDKKVKTIHDCKKNEPEDYLQWHEWARKKSKTHKQSQCSCGLWSVWTKKVKNGQITK